MPVNYMTTKIDTATQTLGQTAEDKILDETTAKKQEIKEEKEDKSPGSQGKTFTQSELDAIVKDRLDRERKKYSDYSDLKAKAQKFQESEDAKLKEDEKLAKKLKELNDKIEEKEKELAARTLRDLKRSKIEQAIADGKMVLPKGKTVDSLVARSIATSEEEIDTDIADLIGYFPPPEPKTEPEKKALGTQTKVGDATKPQSLLEKKAEIDAKLSEDLRVPKLSQRERTDLANLSISLQNKIMRGEV
jgi:hypothetical protein